MTSLLRNVCCFLVLAAIPEMLFAYPVFGTKRYGRSTGLPHRVATWGMPAPMPLQAYQQPQAHYAVAPTYYADAVYPYSQDYADGDYYYAQEPYSYYPSVYHQPPYYYGDGRQRIGGYGYYGYDEVSDPVDDLQEEIHQEEEREEREEALPIGQETWFEGGTAAQRQREDVNAAFLQNLIISQIYNDRRQPQPQPYDYEEYYQDEDEDEDVRELKSLVKKNRSAAWYRPEHYEHVWFPTENGPWYENSWSRGYKRSSINKKQESSEYGPSIPKGTINFTDRKNNLKTTTTPTTPAPTSTTRTPDFDSRRGQKEIALLRPPTPARNPFAAHAITRSRATPSVYDTIKQLLSMEQGLRKGSAASAQENHSRPQKRFVSNEETLVEELSGLKKLAA